MEPNNEANSDEHEQLTPSSTTKTELVSKWLTMEEVGVRFNMEGPRLENACKYLEKRTATLKNNNDGSTITTTLYKVSWVIETTTLVTPALGALIADMPIWPMPKALFGHRDTDDEL